MNDHLTRREALVAALAATALGGGAFARPAAGRASATANIGVVAPLSRPGDQVAGGNILKAAQLWVSWINGRGGVGGQPVALKTYDDKNSREGGAAAVVRAITKDHCSAIFAGWDSKVAQAEIIEAHRLATPFFVSYAWSTEITQAGYPEVVRIGPNNDMLASAFAPFLVMRKYSRVAVIEEDTDFGRGLGGAIRAGATLAGIEVFADQFKRDARDVRPNLRRLLTHKPDALVIAAAVMPAPLLAITQARSLKYTGDIVLGWDYVDETFWKSTGKQGVGAIWPTFSAPTLHLTATGLTFKHAYTKRYKHQPLIYQALVWDQLNAWKWAVDTVGSVAPADVIPVLPRLDMQGTLGRITLSNQPKTVHFNQWEGVPVYFDQATKKGVTDVNAKVLATIRNSAP
jgi:branched-chain amino acid transport system substrate-binding protein